MAEVTVTEIPQTSPPAPCAWVESGYVSDLLQACRDVKRRSFSFFPLLPVCATLRYGGILPCSRHLLKPPSSGSLPPLVAFCLCFHWRGRCREDKVHAEETLSCLPRPNSGSAGARTLFCRWTARSCCPVGGVTVWHRVGSSWRGLVVRLNAQSCR